MTDFLIQPGPATGVVTTQLRRQSFALPLSLSAGHFPHFVHEATTSVNTPACSTGVPTCCTVFSTYQHLAKNTLTTTPRDMRESSNLLPTTAQTARMTQTGCSTLHWTYTRTTSFSPARAVPAQAVPQARKQAHHRRRRRRMLLRPLPVRPAPRQQLLRIQLPRKLRCQM